MAEEKKDTIEETPKAEVPTEKVKEEETKPKAEGVKAEKSEEKPTKPTIKEEKKTEAKKDDKKVESKADDKPKDKKDDKTSGGQGFSPMKRRKRTSEYGQQLSEKQLAKKIYGIRERQFRNYYKEAFRQQGDTGDILRQLLQMRLDNIIYQSGLAKTTRAARQMVSHNYFLVNGQKVNIPSYQVKIKDVITIKPEKEDKKIWDEEAKERIEEKDVPGDFPDRGAQFLRR